MRSLLCNTFALLSLATGHASAQQDEPTLRSALEAAQSAQELAPLKPAWLEPGLVLLANGKAHRAETASPFGMAKRQLLLDAYAWTPSDRWRAVIDGLRTLDDEHRLGALLVIANHGDASDLDRAQELCDLNGDVWREEFRATCARLFDRDGAFESVASKQLWYLPSSLGEELIHATADIGGTPAFEFLGRVLRGREELWPVALADLYRLAQEAPWELPEDLLDYTEDLLRSHDPATRREAARLLGLSAHAPAVAQLIELLDDEESGVAQTAHWALERSMARKLPSESARWRSALAEAKTWWAERAPAVFEDLDSGDPHLALAALKEMARQRFRRRELSRTAADLLRAEDPVLAEVAAGLIGRLGDGSEAPELIAALGRSEPRVKRAAGSALRKLLGARIEDDPVAWSRYWRQQQDARDV